MKRYGPKSYQNKNQQYPKVTKKLFHSADFMYLVPNDMNLVVLIISYVDVPVAKAIQENLVFISRFKMS